ncbi:MAG: hypothetical protein H0Z34_05575 [Brevibacillus sp.]|nr:hypothetical protein [Brevibacillus sp.]
MRVYDCYRLLDEKTRRAIAAEQEHRAGEKLPGTAESRLCDPRLVDRMWQSLNEIEQTAARCFLLHAGQGFLTRKQWMEMADHIHAHLPIGLTGLNRIGFVLTGRKRWSEIGYVMPYEVRQRLLRMLLEEAGESTCPSKDEKLFHYTTGGRGIHLDLFSLLTYVRDQEVPITRQQTIHRRVLHKLTPLISCDDQYVKAWFDRLFPIDVKNVYQPGLAVVLDLALRLGLVCITDNQLVLAEEAVADWLAQPVSDQRQQLMKMLTSCYLPNESWLEVLVLKMENSGTDRWVSLNAAIRTLVRAGFPVPEKAVERALAEWLYPLLGLGWLHLCRDEAGEWWWRWQQAGDEAEVQRTAWYVEPTGDVIGPPFVSLAELWTLSKLGLLCFEGELFRCTLAADRVQAFVLAGGSMTEIERFLTSRCPYPLPNGLRNQLAGWIAQAGRICIEAWGRVRTADRGMLEELSSIPLIRPYIWETVSETDFLFPLSRQADLLSALKQCGYQPQLDETLNIRNQPQAGEWQRQQEAVTVETRSGLFPISPPWYSYQPISRFPDRLEAMPELASLPRMWTRHFQPYHPQTMRDLFKRAQELKLGVRIETIDGSEWEGTPRKLEVEMGYWSITMEVEQKTQKVRLDHIKRVRLLLPDYVGEMS